MEIIKFIDLLTEIHQQDKVTEIVVTIGDFKADFGLETWEDKGKVMANITICPLEALKGVGVTLAELEQLVVTAQHAKGPAQP